MCLEVILRGGSRSIKYSGEFPFIALNSSRRFLPHIVFTHGVRMGGLASGKSLSGLYLRNHKV